MNIKELNILNTHKMGDMFMVSYLNKMRDHDIKKLIQKTLTKLFENNDNSQYPFLFRVLSKRLKNVSTYHDIELVSLDLENESVQISISGYDREYMCETFTFDQMISSFQLKLVRNKMENDQ